MASNSMPTSDTRAHASMTIPLSRIRSITSARLLDAFSFSMAIDVLLSWQSDGVSSSAMPRRLSQTRVAFATQESPTGLGDIRRKGEEKRRHQGESLGRRGSQVGL